MTTKKKEVIPMGTIETQESKDTKRYLAVLEADADCYTVGTLKEIKNWLIENFGIEEFVELTELVGKPRVRKINVSLKF